MVGRVDGNLINGFADQDDGFAVLAMLHLPALFDVVGVSSVFGNGPGASTYASLNDLIAEYDAIDVKGEPPNETGSLPIPRRKVYLGADQFLQTRSNASAFEHDNIHEKVQTDASVAIVKKLEELDTMNKQPGAVEEKLTILAIGPVTNVASAILLMQTTGKDQLINVIEKVVVCGGYRQEGQIFRVGSKQTGDFADMNFDFDVLAVQTLLQTDSLAVVMAGYEAATSFWFTPERLVELRENGDRAIKYVADTFAVKAWVDHWTHDFGTWWDPELDGGMGGDSGKEIPGFHCFDLITAMSMVVPELLPSWEGPTYVKIAPIPREKKAPVANPRLPNQPDAELTNAPTVSQRPLATPHPNAPQHFEPHHFQNNLSPSGQVTKMFAVCPNPAENDSHHGGMIASAKVTYVKGLDPSLPVEDGAEPTETQRRRECLADIIMTVLKKPLSLEETLAIINKARGFGDESNASTSKKPRGKA